MISKRNSDLIIQSLKNLNSYNLKKFLPIKYKDKKIGWINRKKLAFFKKKLECSFLNSLCIIDLYSNGSDNIQKLYNCIVDDSNFKYTENCSIFNFDSLNPKRIFKKNQKFEKEQIYKIPRIMLNILGLPAYGVHCNGWKAENNNIFFYLSKRSKKLKTFPGLYDNLIGGGQPYNLSLKENLMKEGFEEVGLKKSVINKAELKSFNHYIHDNNDSLNSSIIATFDLELDRSFKFNGKDDEVEKVEKFETSEIFELLQDSKLKPNCLIPIIDFLLRKKKRIFRKNEILEIKKYIF